MRILWMWLLVKQYSPVKSRAMVSDKESLITGLIMASNFWQSYLQLVAPHQLHSTNIFSKSDQIKIQIKLHKCFIHHYSIMFLVQVTPAFCVPYFIKDIAFLVPTGWSVFWLPQKHFPFTTSFVLFISKVKFFNTLWRHRLQIISVTYLLRVSLTRIKEDHSKMKGKKIQFNKKMEYLRCRVKW